MLWRPNFTSTYRGVIVLNVKARVSTFNQEKAEGPVRVLLRDCSPHVLSNDHTIRRERDMERVMEIKAYFRLEKRATPKFQAQGMSIQFHNQDMEMDMEPYLNLKLEIIGGNGKLGVHASAAAVVRASKLKLQSSKQEKEYV